MPESYYFDMFTDGGDMPDRQYTLTGSSGSVAYEFKPYHTINSIGY